MTVTIFVTALLWALAKADGWYSPYDWNSDADLESYVSRPDLRPPKFDITYYKKELITPGYWFVAPYVDIINRAPTRLYSPDQVGPHIYDNEGQLVWSGAHLFHGRNTYDFKPVSADKGANLSFALSGDDHDKEFPGGGGVIIDPSFKIRQKVKVKGGAGTMNMHEFSVVDDGTKALLFAHESRLYDEPHPDGRAFAGWIVDLCFVEIDIATGKNVFEWWASDHVHPLDSTVPMINLPGSANGPWDYFHINSIDKTKDGDYLVSGRHVNTIFKVSGLDGHVKWRLGGVNSSFVHDDEFTFSSQHDARVQSENSTTTVVSFLNNASDGHRKTGKFSAALEVALYTAEKPMRAQVIGVWERPDLETTDLRGNNQILPNKNVFVCWSGNSYISEFTHDGRCLFEAKWKSWRFATYRAWKFNFTGHPEEPPALKAFVYGTSSESMSTVYYVSWNGATEVAKWNFYAHTRWGGKFQKVGSAKKTGFETVFVHKGYAFQVVAEAVDAKGKSLHNTTIQDPILPQGYKSIACDGKDCDFLSYENDEPGMNIPAALSSEDFGQSGSGNGFPDRTIFILMGILTMILGYAAFPRSLLKRFRSSGYKPIPTHID